jgi:hypothetical protein
MNLAVAQPFVGHMKKNFRSFLSTLFGTDEAKKPSHATVLLKEDLDMPSAMYCTIHLLEIMRLSAFKSPLFYPSS